MDQWRTEEPQFVTYYHTKWHTRIERWAKKHRNYAHANQDSNGGIERWHSTLKTHLRASRKNKGNRTVSWLITMLTDTIESFFWCSAELKHQGRLRNQIIGRLVLAAIRKAKDIPDDNVTMYKSEEGMTMGRVISCNNSQRAHEINGYDTHTAACTCGSALQGNICKHQV